MKKPEPTPMAQKPRDFCKRGWIPKKSVPKLKSLHSAETRRPQEKVFLPKRSVQKKSTRQQKSGGKETTSPKELGSNYKVGGNTANCVHVWQKISNDPWVLNSVQGIIIPLKYIPFQGVEPRPIKWLDSERKLLHDAIATLEDKNVIELCEEESFQFISNVFLVPKPNGKARVILDLSRFNDSVEKVHFKMDNLHTATNIIVPGVFMTSIDLQDAYFTFPISVKDRKFLKFRWEGKLWRFIGLPMGITCALFYFTKLITPIFAYMRRKGNQCFPYLDDSFIFGFSEDECKASTLTLFNLF